MRPFLIVLVGFLMLEAGASSAWAQAKRVPFEGRVEKIEGIIEPADAKPGQTVLYKVIVKLKPGYHTYPQTQPEGHVQTFVTRLIPPENSDLIFVETATDPMGGISHGQGGEKYLAYDNGVEWVYKAVVSPNATAGKKEIAFKTARMTICDEESCLPKSVSVVAPLQVIAGSVPVEKQYEEAVTKALGIRATPPPPKKEVVPVATPKTQEKPLVETGAEKFLLRPDGDFAADLKTVQEQLQPFSPSYFSNTSGSNSSGFWVFIATAISFGFLTLLTPCVFPMVPITVSVFLKQAEKQKTNPLVQALIYATTIVTVLTIAALTVLQTFSSLAVHPVTNVLLGALFVALALSLFGMFELTLPSWIANLSNKQESRGKYLGTIFMAISFTIVSFTCVAPFLGGFSGMTASGNYTFWQLLAGALAFATAFASPFFVLAIFPSLLKKIPKSGDWMNTVKATMGFLELAAALKFFRTAELRLFSPTEYFTYDGVMALWVVIFLAMGLYLLGVFRLAHDYNDNPHIGAIRLLFAIGALGLSAYLIPGMFANGIERQRPTGVVFAWIDSFLLPEPKNHDSSDLLRAIEKARKEKGRVFIDFTGVTCSNCRLNEQNVFVLPQVSTLLNQYSVVKVYTDTVPVEMYDGAVDIDKREADGDASKKFQTIVFGNDQLPLYVILKPESDGRTTVVGVYKEGKINNVNAFVNFLKEGLK
jgi:thiol:disulfide interchange protein